MVGLGSAAFRPDAWHDLGVGVAGAAAALTGLLFVSLSINLRLILDSPWLPRRAGLTLILLFETLVVSLVLLTPFGSRFSLGVSLLVPAFVGWLAGTIAFAVRTPPFEPRGPIVANLAAVQVATLVALAAAVSVLVGAGGGLYWLVLGVVLLLGVGVINAWVLLIEILR